MHDLRASDASMCKSKQSFYAVIALMPGEKRNTLIQFSNHKAPCNNVCTSKAHSLRACQRIRCKVDTSWLNKNKLI